MWRHAIDQKITLVIGYLAVPSVVRRDQSTEASMTAFEIPENRILRQLPRAQFQRLRALMSPVTTQFRQVLYHAHAPIEYVYFLNSGAASAVAVMKDGSTIEVATIGREGVVGLSALLASRTSPNEVIIQIAGDALRISSEMLEPEARSDGPLRDLLLRYQTAFLTQISYSVACNGLHPIQKRCCRWLLTMQDSIGSNQLELTHEFLAVMLGVRRPSVTEVLRPLQEQGLLLNGRGVITILDRKGLEALACECYQIVRQEYERLFGD